MKERPILFNGEMVRAILNGSKTQTRRPMSRQKDKGPVTQPDDFVLEKLENGIAYMGDGDGLLKVKCPFGAVGDRLWVRETFWERGHWSQWAGSEPIEPVWCPTINDYDGKPDILCVRFDEQEDKSRWLKRPSIHMPRWASRITLEITGVRMERIQEITQGEAVSEGYETDIRPFSTEGPPKHQFIQSWNKTYPGSWERNDWVWVIEFKKI